MKLHVYQEAHSGKIRFYNTPQPENVRNWQYLGEMEIEPKLPKKMVTKETNATRIGFTDNGAYKVVAENPLPPNAQNIRILYDVEE